MSINKENIEEYIFDYLEGNLTNEQVLEFREYINSNSEAKKELEYWKDSYVVDNLRVDSSEFSLLKKSNKLYYWISAAGIAFLLGAGSTYFVLENNIESADQKDVIVDQNILEAAPTLKENSIEKVEIETVVSEENIAPIKDNNISTSNKTESENEEIIDVVEMNSTTVREIDLNSSESNREVVSDKINVKENVQKEEEIKKKKKAVDVIELNSEGF